MQALAATSGIKSQSARSKSEKNRSNDVDYASELSFSPAIKAPTRWPGAVLKGDLGCCTPQTQRSSAMLQIFSQSPYSHTLVSRYTSKVNADATLCYCHMCIHLFTYLTFLSNLLSVSSW